MSLPIHAARFVANRAIEYGNMIIEVQNFANRVNQEVEESEKKNKQLSTDCPVCGTVIDIDVPDDEYWRIIHTGNRGKHALSLLNMEKKPYKPVRECLERAKRKQVKEVEKEVEKEVKKKIEEDMKEETDKKKKKELMKGMKTIHCLICRGDVEKKDKHKNDIIFMGACGSEVVRLFENPTKGEKVAREVGIQMDKVGAMAKRTTRGMVGTDFRVQKKPQLPRSVKPTAWNNARLNALEGYVRVAQIPERNMVRSEGDGRSVERVAVHSRGRMTAISLNANHPMEDLNRPIAIPPRSTTFNQKARFTDDTIGAGETRRRIRDAIAKEAERQGEGLEERPPRRSRRLVETPEDMDGLEYTASQHTTASDWRFNDTGEMTYDLASALSDRSRSGKNTGDMRRQKGEAVTSVALGMASSPGPRVTKKSTGSRKGATPRKSRRY